MRRKDREISDKSALIEILESADVCRIAMQSEHAPYIVPLNYGFMWDERLVIYFHCAAEGRKLDLIEKNNRVGFEVDTGHALMTGERACDWGMKYKSIIGSGKISRVEDGEEKRKALDSIMRHYGFTETPVYGTEVFGKTVVLRLAADEITGKEKK